MPGTPAGKGSRACRPYGETHHPTGDGDQGNRTGVGRHARKRAAERLGAGWIGYNVLDWFMRDMTTKELIIMADPNRPRHYEEEFKRQIVQLYENGKPSSRIRAEYGIPRSTLQRWVQGIRNSGSTKAADNRTPEENELIELRKRNRQLEMEVDVLKQAAPVFARK
ncbi:transposase [uncultured Bifidobacterium sp.]|nr:transposase [uncultured Bifidobacterium sp.]